MKMYCDKCKIEYEEGKKFCKKCGSPLKTSPKTDPKLVAAKEVYELKLNEDPLNIDLLIEYGKALNNAGELNDAAKQFEKVLAVESENRTAIDFLIDIYDQLSQPDKSEEYLKKLIKISGITEELVVKLANIQSHSQKNINKAIQTLKEGLENLPNNVSLLKEYFTLLKSENKYEDLIEIGEKLKQLEAIDAEIVECMADSALALEKNEQAIKYFRELIDIEPDSQRASFYYQYGKLIDTKNVEDFPKFKEILGKIDTSALSSKEKQGIKFSIAYCKLGIGESDKFDRSIIIEYLKSSNITSSENLYAIILSAYRKILESITEKDVSDIISELQALYNITKRQELLSLKAEFHWKAGLDAEANNNINHAIDNFSKANELVPDNTDYVESYKRVISSKSKKKKKLVIFSSAALMAVAIVSVIIFLMYGKFYITIDPASNVTIYKGNEEIKNYNDVELIKSDFLFSGDYRIVANSPGYSEAEEIVNIGFGRNIYNVSLKLLPKYGSLSISSNPTGAELYIDSKRVGKTPYKADSILAKKINVRLEKRNYKSHSTSIKILENETIIVPTVNLDFTEEVKAAKRARAAADKKERLSGYYAQISNIDDRATIYINDVEAIEGRYSYHPGKTAKRDISKYLKLGSNSFRFEVYNNAGCCHTSATFRIYRYDNILVEKRFSRSDSKSGIKYNVTVNLEI